MPEEDLQKAQMLQKQLEQLEEYQEKLDDDIEKLEEAKEALGDLKSGDEGSRMLAPLGSGVFVEAELTDASQVITSLGADIYEKHDTGEAKDVMDERIERMRETREEVGQTKRQLQQQMQGLQQQLMQERDDA